MRFLKLTAMISCAVLVLFAAAERVQADFPEYVNQNSDTTNWHSGIDTSDGLTVWDSAFAWMVTNPLGLSYEETAFGFMQCFGGGMIDELLPVVGTNFDVSSFTSAARHNEQSWNGVRDPASGGKRESYYNLHYSPWAGGAVVRRHDQAGQNAYNNDLVGPVVQNPLREHPQYLFTYLLMDKTDVTLHRPNQVGGETPDKYRSIVFGGSSSAGRDGWANYNSVARIHSDLLARGYTNDEIYLMYPSNTKPNGTALPASWVVDDGTTYQDMLDAWTWMQNQSDENLQVYFWSSICHGSRTYDVVGAVWDDLEELIEIGQEYAFDLEAAFVDQVRDLFNFFDDGPGSIVAKPYFQVIAPELVGDLSVILNDEPLAFLEVSDYDVCEETRFLYKFALDRTDIDNLSVTSNTFEFNWIGGPIDFRMAGLTTGDMANAIPEPTSLVLLALGGLVLLRKKRRA